MEVKNWFWTLFFCINVWVCQGQDDLQLWYDQPADNWLQAVPLGNGRLGAMPDGQVFKEELVLNDITLWSGSPQDANRKGAVEHLPEIRKLIFEGENDQAEALVNKYFVSKGKGSGYGKGADIPYGSYQVLGHLHLDYDYGKDSTQIHAENYRRELSLDSALASTQFEIDDITYRREYFTSFSDDVIMIRLTADQSGKINFNLSLDRPERYETSIKGNELQMQGQLNDGKSGKKGVRYLTRVQIVHSGGDLKASDSGLQIERADTATIYISSGTDFKDNKYKQKTEENLKNALTESYTKAKKTHIKAYQKLFHRASLSLKNEQTKQAALPTDERLIAYKENPTDNSLPVLYFQYGRYLLISSTRPGLLPPNLQGLWANTIDTPWNGDYHMNINIQMNHWPIEVTNLPMLNEPFFTLVEGLVKPGEKTAKTYYNGKGWVAHVITNVWGYTAPGENASWGSTNSGSGWMSNVLWRHYAFTLDQDYLRKIYPVIKGSAEFYLSTLVKDPRNGWLVTAPSNSPENAFKLPNGKIAHITAGPTIDNQILRELFTHVIQAGEILNVDKKFRQKLDEARAQLPPNQIDEHGRIMEWLKPYEEVEPHHRHVSPLWGLYPGNEISLTETPKMAEASEKLLKRRGDVSTGWSTAWKINLWARLHQGNHSFKLFRKLVQPIKTSNAGGAYPNLFDAHPPFQIDGNFGGTAGIAEMLVQSHTGVIEFLPALPDQWGSGSFSGLRVRGGGVVSAQWKKNQLKQVSLKAQTDHKFKIHLAEALKKQMNMKFTGQKKPEYKENYLIVHMKKGDQLKLDF